MEWLQEHIVVIQVVSAAVQALTAIAIGVLTLRLVRSTDRYARTTDQSLRLAQQQFALTEQQFERQWVPQLHISLLADGQSSRLRVLNLSQVSVVITNVAIGTDEDEAVEPYHLDMPVSGSEANESGDITELIRRSVDRHVRNNVWAGTLRLRTTFYVAGIARPSDWTLYQIRLENGRITEAARRFPVEVAARQIAER